MLGIKSKTVSSDKIISSSHLKIYYSSNVWSISTLKLIIENIREADVIHLNGLFNKPVSITLLFWALFFTKKNMVCSVRGELSPSALLYSRWKKQPSLLIYRLFFKKILFHVTSEQEDADVKLFFKGCKTIVVPNLMYPAEKIMGIQKKKKFLFMGRIHKIKALHKFIEGLALSKLFKKSGFTFDITGTHEDRHLDYFQSLKNSIKDFGLEEKILFSGHLTGIEKEQKYAESYFLILPSESENFGNVVVEALNQNTPVLASLGTPWKILENYGCGYHTNNSPADLSHYIDHIISLDDNTYNKMCENASKLVEEKFNIKTQINRWIDNYQNLNMNHENTK